MEVLHIVELIEKNPITKLTLSYVDVVGITCGIMECNGIIYKRI
jgi:hypothetical protein